jgi:hypothetical protein
MQQRLSPKGSTLREVEAYYTLLDSYIKILMSWSQEKPIDPADRKKAENLRQKLLLSQARMVSFLGDPTYSQFGTVASAWNGLQEYQHGYRGPLLTSLKILKDAILVGMGELRNEVQLQRSSVYERTSPVYWVKCFWRWKPVIGAIAWAKANRLLSMIISAVIAGIVMALLGYFLKWLR